MKKIRFEVEGDFHLRPSVEIYKEIVNIYRQTGCRANIKIYYKPEIKSELSLSDEPGQSISFIGNLIGTEKGDIVDIYFDPPVSEMHMKRLKKKIYSILSHSDDIVE